MLFSWQNFTLLFTPGLLYICENLLSSHWKSGTWLQASESTSVLLLGWFGNGRGEEILILNNFLEKEENTFQQATDEFRCILIAFNFNIKTLIIVLMPRI